MSDNINSVIRRYSSMIDTSGAEPPRGAQMAAIMGGGVYTNVADTATTDGETILNGRLSLGILGAFVLGAVGFYVWTHNIQGGG